MSMCHSSGYCAVGLGEVWVFSALLQTDVQRKKLSSGLEAMGNINTTNVLFQSCQVTVQGECRLKNWTSLSRDNSILSKIRVSVNSLSMSVNAGIGEYHRGTFSVLLRDFFHILIHVEGEMLKKPLPCYAQWRITCQWVCLVTESWGSSTGKCSGTSRDNFQLSNSSIWQVSLKGPVPLIFSCLPNFACCQGIAGNSRNLCLWCILWQLCRRAVLAGPDSNNLFSVREILCWS